MKLVRECTSIEAGGFQGTLLSHRNFSGDTTLAHYLTKMADRRVENGGIRAKQVFFTGVVRTRGK